MAINNRIVDLGTRSAFNYERATIIIYNMPLQDQELYGRLKDTVLRMAEVLDIHMRSLEVVTRAIERGDTLLSLLKRNAELLCDINTRIRTQRDEDHRGMKSLIASIASVVAAAGPTSPQKPLLRNLARDMQAQAQAAFDRSVVLEKMLDTFSAETEESLPKESPAATNADGTPSNSVELF
jgi:hypothetical protein